MARSRAKKSAKKSGAKKTGTKPAVKRGGSTKSAARRRPKRSRKMPRTRVDIDTLSAEERARIFDSLERRLKELGVNGSLASVHLVTEATARETALVGCPAGQVRRMVCNKVHGVVVCEPKCVTV
jgi:hypothetical protein